MITRTQIHEVLAGFLDPGETVLVHSSLKAIGHLEEGPQALIEELLKVLGPQGNLVMIGSSRDFSRTGIFDIRNSKADTGLLAETFRNMPGVLRSPVPMASFLAKGPAAALFTSKYEGYLDDSSPMVELLRRDGRILLVGISYDKCTMFHLAEERLQVDYNTYLTFKGRMLDEHGESHDIQQRYYVRKSLATKKSVNWIGEQMESQSAVLIRRLGKGCLRLFRAREFDNRCMAALSKDRSAFLVS